MAIQQAIPAMLAPRDLTNLAMLKAHGLTLVEVKISQVSAAKGQLVRNVSLPDSTCLLCVIRQGNPILDLNSLFLEEKDAVFLLTDDEQAVRDLFIV